MFLVFFNITLFIWVDILPICSMLDIQYRMSLPKTNSLGDFIVVLK